MIRQTLGRAKTAAKTLTRAKYDALDMLRADHMKIEAMLMQLRVVRNADHRSRLLREIRSELTKHMRIEEEILYPACCEVQKIHDLADHSYDEHAEVQSMFDQLETLNASDKKFSSLVTRIIVNIEKHVYKEENRLFPMARKLIGKTQFNRINREIMDAHGQRPTRARRAA